MYHKTFEMKKAEISFSTAKECVIKLIALYNGVTTNQEINLSSDFYAIVM